MPKDDNGFEFDIPEELRPYFLAKQQEMKKRMEKIGRFFILERDKIKAVDKETWMWWYASGEENRRVDETDISNEPKYPGGDCVSTIFLGMDHNFNFDEVMVHVPTLFETMVFGGKWDQRMWRYATYGEAKRGHWQIVDCIRRGERPYTDRGERPLIDYFWEMFDDSNPTSTTD